MYKTYRSLEIFYFDYYYFDLIKVWFKQQNIL